jgi:Mg2+ and Co2+ transporter CorA
MQPAQENDMSEYITRLEVEKMFENQKTECHASCDDKRLPTPKIGSVIGAISSVLIVAGGVLAAYYIDRGADRERITRCESQIVSIEASATKISDDIEELKKDNTNTKNAILMELKALRQDVVTFRGR